MKASWAEDNLQVIRTLMENSAVYRRAIAPIMVTMGIVGIVAAVIGLVLQIGLQTFWVYWFVVAFVAIALAFVLARRQAMKDDEPFWSGPTRRVAEAVIAPLLAGAVLTLFARYDATFVVGIWLLFYGCALRAAGFFTLRGVGEMGWLFVLTGAVFLGITWRTEHVLTTGLAHGAMGVCFGGFHLAYGLYLTFTKKT